MYYLKFVFINMVFLKYDWNKYWWKNLGYKILQIWWTLFYYFFSLFLLFIFYEKVGKYLLMGWLFMWLLTQFFSHWYYTIFGPSEGKINYFADTIKLIPSSNTYIPDLYHIILHVLILVSLMCVLSNLIFSKKAL